MNFQLSPQTVFGLKEHLHDAQLVTLPPDQDDTEPDSVIAYTCPECNHLYKYRSDARDCCADERKTRLKLKPERDVVPCPVCRTDCDDVFDAADCCLWKHLDQPTRRQIAEAVENGATWAEQLLPPELRL